MTGKKNSFDQTLVLLRNKSILFALTVVFGLLTLISLRVHYIIAVVMTMFFLLFLGLLLNKRKMERMLDQKLNNNK